MSFNALRKAVYDKFDSMWTGSHVARGRNTKFDPPKGPGVTWVRISVAPFNTKNVEVGRGRQRTTGEIMVECHVPLLSGDQIFADMVDEVKAIFENTSFDGVNTFATSMVPVGEVGDWYKVNANTSFYYDVTT